MYKLNIYHTQRKKFYLYVLHSKIINFNVSKPYRYLISNQATNHTRHLLHSKITITITIFVYKFLFITFYYSTQIRSTIKDMGNNALIIKYVKFISLLPSYKNLMSQHVSLFINMEICILL